jgi:hypothetical protein
MIEQMLLDQLTTTVSALGLTPAPQLIGVTEPNATGELPAVVLAIEQSQRLGNGLGERSALIADGALAWRSTINLANPVLPGDPSFSLLSPDRRRLTLPHGGLVRSTAMTGPLTASDLQVRVQGNLRTLVGAAPGAGEYTADPLTGTLEFGEALPTTGTLEANYFLGQWEQRVVRGIGLLRLAVVAADAAAVRDLSNRLLAAFADPSTPGGLPAGLAQLSVAEIGSIGAAGPPLPAARQRIVRFRFEFEQELNVPESSGGIIQRIPIQALVG